MNFPSFAFSFDFPSKHVISEFKPAAVCVIENENGDKMT